MCEEWNAEDTELTSGQAEETAEEAAESEAEEPAQEPESQAEPEPDITEAPEPVQEPRSEPEPQPDETLQMMQQMDSRLNGMCAAEQMLVREVQALHKLMQNEVSGRIGSMNAEIERCRKQESGAVYDGILRSIAQIYCDFETLPEETDDPKLKKNLRFLLTELEELLEAYGVCSYRSKPGDKRKPEYCKSRNFIPTDDPSQSEIVVKSHGPCFYIGKRVLIREEIDVYRYTAPAADEPAISEQ